MSTVDEARATLARAEEEQREAERQALSDRLMAVRADLRTARARYYELSNALRREIEYRSMMHAKIHQAFDEIDVCVNARPRGAEYTPSDPECIRWQAWHDALVAHREALSAELAEYPQTPRVELARYEGATGLVTTLEYAEQNLLRQLEPGDESWSKGGIYRVG